MSKPKDYYRLLGVPQDATPDRIKRAYRRLARQWHPDLSGGSPEQFQSLQDAYEILTNADARARYDRTLDRQREPPPRPIPFWSATGRGEGVRPPLSPTPSGEIFLTAAEAARGGTFPLDIPIRSVCRECGGASGGDCLSCGGDGFAVTRLPAALRLPRGLRDGAVFQIHLDAGVPVSVMLTIHIVGG